MKLITLSEAAARLGVSRQTLTNWGHSGTIKLHKMGKSVHAYWVDADTVEALADTMKDIENARQMLMQEQEELNRLRKEERETLRDLRRTVFMLKKFGKGIVVKEFYLSIPTMLCDIGVLNVREETIMKRIINGDEIEWVADKFHLTNARIAQIFLKGCRKARNVEHLKETLDEAQRSLNELEYLRKKAKVDADYIKELEAELVIKREPQEEQDKELLMKRLVDFDLSVRTLNCLKAADIETVGELLKLNKLTLLNFRNFGKRSLAELDDFLKSIGKEWGTKYLVPVFSEGHNNDRRYFKGYRLSDRPS